MSIGFDENIGYKTSFRLHRRSGPFVNQSALFSISSAATFLWVTVLSCSLHIREGTLSSFERTMYLPRASSKVPTFDAESSSCTRIFEFVVNDSSRYRHGVVCMDVLSRTCTRENDLEGYDICYSYYHFCPTPALRLRTGLCLRRLIVFESSPCYAYELKKCID